MKTFKSEMSGWSSAVQFLFDIMDTSNSLMKVKAELAAVKEENANLRTQNITLSTEFSGLRQRLRELEQYTRKNNKEISGIPLTPGEEHRVGSRNNPGRGVS